MAQTVIGMFDNSTEAQQAVEKLVSSGISRDRIDVSDQSSSSSTSSTDSYSSSGSTSTSRDRDDDHNDNAITRFFKNLFGDDDDDADRYSKVASRAKSIVTVHANSSDEAEDAADILDDNGAVDVNERASDYGYGKSTGSSTGNMSGSGIGSTGVGAGVAALTGSGDADYTDTERTRSTDTDYTGTSDRTTNDESRKIPVIKEDVEIGKQEVQSGGARIRSRIVERPVEESIRLRQERVNVERNPVDRPATDSDFSNFEEKDIEMVERSEVPVVNKQARVVEEVSLNKEVEETSETIRETARETEVDVDDLDKKDVRNRSTDNI